MATVGAVALALGLAFGLGGRDTAARIVSGWYERGQQAAPSLAEAASAAQGQIQSSPRPLADLRTDARPMGRSAVPTGGFDGRPASSRD